MVIIHRVTQASNRHRLTEDTSNVFRAGKHPHFIVYLHGNGQIIQQMVNSLSENV